MRVLGQKPAGCLGLSYHQKTLYFNIYIYSHFQIRTYIDLHTSFYLTIFRNTQMFYP